MWNCSRLPCKKSQNFVPFKQRLSSRHSNIRNTTLLHTNVAQITAHNKFDVKLSASFATNYGQTTQKSQYESNTLPAQTKAVICGGGVMGASIAYHLAVKGLANQVVLLEQDRFDFYCNFTE